MRLFNLLKKAFYKLGLIDDFVVERGYAGTYTWRKWYGGEAECWLWGSGTYACTTAGFGGYYHLNAINITLPITFIAAPVIVASASCNSVIGNVTHVWATANYVQLTPIVGRSGSRVVSYQVYTKGAWK